MFQFSGDSSLTRRCSETFARKCFSAFFHHRLQCYHNFKIFIKKKIDIEESWRRELSMQVSLSQSNRTTKKEFSPLW